MPYTYLQFEKNIKIAIDRVQKAMYLPVADLKINAWVTPEPVVFEDRFIGEEKNLKLGETWGELWDCGWFHLMGEVPKAGFGEKIVLLIDVNGEGCIVDKQGTPLRGLTNISSSFDFTLGKPGKKVVQLIETARGGEVIDLWMETGCNDLFGKYSKKGTMKEASIAICKKEMRALHYDIEVLVELMKAIPDTEARHMRILHALNQATLCLNEYTEQEAVQARKILQPELEKKGGDPSLRIHAIGHAHMDLAWQWPIRETIRKGGRTFSTVLELMERYPEYKFGASQPQLYQWMKDRYPSLYEKIKKAIAEGRWETQGAMWVEPDTNISGGEALIRQILYGKKYYREEFQQEVDSLWLPDVFGYTAALPQILKKSGVDYFMTIKLSWNEYNQFPHHTFRWEGIDGSKVLCHMPPEGEYNSAAGPQAIKKTERNFLDKSVSEDCLMLFGIGDGGGGPGAEHLERLSRVKNLQGLCPVEQKFSRDFFHQIDQPEMKYQTWKGELYLEKHQGTLTTQAKNKKYNRKMELMLRELEFTAALAKKYLNKPYPEQALEAIWKEVLLYQFHDILPGSSIKRVYDESLERYESLLNQTLELLKEAQHEITCAMEVGGEAEKEIAFNSLSWERNEWVKRSGEWVFVEVPALGVSVVNQGKAPCMEGLSATENSMENQFLSIRFDKDGSIESIFDKMEKREVMMPGAYGNRLIIYQDGDDAWDFPMDYHERSIGEFALQDRQIELDGPSVVSNSIYWYGESVLEQKIVLKENSRRIDFQTKVSWRERKVMLRTDFPLNLYAKEAVCDIQFGTIDRALHRNTSWEMAKYEICAHKWVDLSQRDYGVALINDCKYGYYAEGNQVGLNLLRGTSVPGIEADLGDHEFTYSLYPHAGDHVAGEVARQAYELNIPLSLIKRKRAVASKTILPSRYSMIAIDQKNVIVETIKKAEADDGIIIRMYENSGASCKVKLRLNFECGVVRMVGLMEDNLAELHVKNNELLLAFEPFEIVTIKVDPIQDKK